MDEKLLWKTSWNCGIVELWNSNINTPVDRTSVFKGLHILIDGNYTYVCSKVTISILVSNYKSEHINHSVNTFIYHCFISTVIKTESSLFCFTYLGKDVNYNAGLQHSHPCSLHHHVEEEG